MKLHRKWLSCLVVLAVAAICLLVLPTQAHAASASDLTFALNSDGASYSVTDCKTSASGEWVIPATYNGKPVTTIGDDAFYYCTSLTSVTIPDSVTTIGKRAFQSCCNLTSITIPDSVTSISNDAFSWCDNLTSVTIPDSVTNIGDRAFRYCVSLTSITIPDSVTSIGHDAFYYCTSLTSITIPDSVTSIGDWTFAKCSSLTNVTYCGTQAQWNQISIGSYNEDLTTATLQFHDCKNGVCLYCGLGVDWKYTIANNAVTITGYTGSETNLIIPDTIEGYPVTTIGSEAFRECTSLTSITIPDSVTSIEGGAFYYCLSLTSVTIPDSVITIGNYAFEECTSLTSITIPNSVTTIGNFAFYNCTSLTSVTIGNGVTTIGYSAFWACPSLTCITIPDSVTTIGSAAFSGCYNLTSASIGNSVTTIGSYAFSECTRLTSITIPDSVTSIEDGAFYYCDSLTSVVYCGTQAQWNQISIGSDNEDLTTATLQFHDCKNGVCLYCGLGVDWEYTISNNAVTITGYTGSEANLIIPDIIESYPVTTIGERAFYNCTWLTSITIPDSVDTIGEYAFSFCTSLTQIRFAGRMWISTGAFSNCKNLATVIYCGTEAEYFKIDNENVYVEAGNSPYHAASLQFHNFENGVCTFCAETQGIKYVIYQQTAIITDYTGNDTEVVIPSVIDGYPVFGIDDYAFYKCTNLTSINIPASIDYIGYNAFYGCSNLSTIIYCGTQEQWDNVYIYSQNSSLTDATLQFHNYEEMVLAPTCNRGGYTTKKCTRCGGTFKTDETEALGHDLKVVSILAPTCNRGGYTTKKCTRCGGTFKTYETEALGHDLEVVSVLAPTCNRGGYTTKKCTRCGGTFKTDATEALGHDLEVVSVLAPTCNRGGYTTKKCTRCGGTFKTDETEALGHNFDQQVKNIMYRKSAATATSGAMFYYACADCGESSEGHTNATWEYVNTAYTSSSVARVGNKYYNSLNAAITAAGENETVVLLKAVKEGQAINITKNITIDFGGFTYTVSEASKTGAAIMVADGVEATMTNGTVQIRYTARNDFNCLVENAGTVIVSNITLKGNNVGAAGAVLVKGNALIEGEGVAKVDPAK